MTSPNFHCSIIALVGYPIVFFQKRYHEALGNVTLADLYYGRDQEIKARREEIRKNTMRLRRTQNCSLRLV